MQHSNSNALIHETSPYLLQHAYNPVHWNPWNENVLQKARDKNKLLLISVGYAACHWCHVMEHESFEDAEVAEMMNSHFINIKVDREERPDIDQVYMNAIQIMTGSGGWPMNVIALPDGRPFWGGTYFRKDQWINALQQIATLYQESPEKIIEYADRLEMGIKRLDEIIPNTQEPIFKKEELSEAVHEWSTHFDHKRGGLNRAPKFMMPNNYHFLMRYAHQSANEELMSYVKFTLKKMAYGGVYDQIGGGFSRYSVDAKWHVPHFEKMLYDNAQLVSLYADAYSIYKDDLYKNVVYETLEFVNRELTGTEGNFYSSLDADSLNEKGDSEEGAYYVWKESALQSLLNDDFDIFKSYYNINDYGYWEHENYVLIRNNSEEEIAAKFEISPAELKNKVAHWKKILLKERDKRKRPGLDDKTLTSWNALMLKAYVNAYQSFEEHSFLDIALKNGYFIVKNVLHSDGRLDHNYKAGKSTINAYLEDYATVIDAFMHLYEATIDEQWLSLSKKLTDYCFNHFFDTKSKMFFFTSDIDPALISRSIEKYDNVIPASNSILAKSLFKLSHYYGDKKYLDTAIQMLNTIRKDIPDYPSGHSNWMDLMLDIIGGYYEIAILGEKAKEKLRNLNALYLPNKLIAGSNKNSTMHLLKERFVANETLIYVCKNNTCQLPVKTTEEAMNLIKTSL